MDISIKSNTSTNIFRHILNNGPSTLYAASIESKIPLGTIHRHFKEMEKEGKIKVYYQNTTGRKKKAYGPTFYGIVHFARIDKQIIKKIENYFLIWIENETFTEILKKEGFDIKDIQKTTSKNKILFKKYVEYGIAIENQIELLKKNSKNIPHELFVFIGETLLSSDPKFVDDWTYLYKNLPGLQKAIQNNIEKMQQMQKQLRIKN